MYHYILDGMIKRIYDGIVILKLFRENIHNLLMYRTYFITIYCL